MPCNAFPSLIATEPPTNKSTWTGSHCYMTAAQSRSRSNHLSVRAVLKHCLAAAAAAPNTLPRSKGGPFRPSSSRLRLHPLFDLCAHCGESIFNICRILCRSFHELDSKAISKLLSTIGCWLGKKYKAGVLARKNYRAGVLTWHATQLQLQSTILHHKGS